MSLATRCNACGTVFRLVRDQLRVSDGWVRCGTCHAVFNATDDLFELDDGGTQAATPADQPDDLAQRVIAELDADRRRWRTEAGSLPVTWTARPAEGLDDVVRPTASVDEPAAVADEAPEETIAIDEPLDAGLDEAEPDAAEAVMPALPPPEDDRPAAIVALSGGSSSDDTAVAPPEPVTSAEAESAPPLPSFVRRADRAAFWQRPLVRAATAVAAALLATTLLVQIGHAGRDWLAAHWPTLAPTLHALCAATGCKVEPLKQADRLSVDSAGLMLIEGPPLYRLQVVLHNRADTALAVPALELTLEDAQGVVVARRVLQAGELGLDSPLIEAGAQLPVTVTLTTRERRIAGYHVELFYP